VWTQNSNALGSLNRGSGAGHAFVGANEEVLCWDVKKGELLSRWRDSKCSAEVTAIERSHADPDVYAVGYVIASLRSLSDFVFTIIAQLAWRKSRDGILFTPRSRGMVKDMTHYLWAVVFLSKSSQCL